METTNSVSDAFPLKGRRFSSNPVISVEDVTKTYPGAAGPAVAGLSFTLNAGKVLAVLGPSGCGKTTTLRLIAGFEAPDADAHPRPPLNDGRRVPKAEGRHARTKTKLRPEVEHLKLF